MNELVGKKVFARGAEKATGVVQKGSRRCNLEGCRGRRIKVRWPDGKITWPCLKGITEDDGKLRIIWNM